MEGKHIPVMVAPQGTVTITTEEYSELVASKALLETIVAAAKDDGYGAERIIVAICKAFPDPNPIPCGKEEQTDA